MKKLIFISILIATFATKSFAYCPIPQWCPKADLHQTVCSGQPIDAIEFPTVMGKTLVVEWWTDGTRSALAGTPSGITVSGGATSTNNRDYLFPVSISGSPTAVGTHHYTVSNLCGVLLLSGSITVAGPPTIGTVTPTGNRYTTVGTAFTPLTLTAEPAGSMPPITIQWFSNITATNSGGINLGSANGAQTDTFTPPATTPNAPNGIFYYAVATNSCGSTATNVSGKHIIGPVCPATTNPTPSNNRCSPTRDGTTFTGIGTQFFKTSTIWQISGNGISQQWSDVVLTSTCGKTGFAGGTDPNFNNDCRQNRITGTNETRPTAVNQGGNTANYFGDLFSWCAVMTHAAVLCPGTWRVPTCQDFINLDIALGGTGLNRTDITVRNKYLATSGESGQFWGAAYAGYCANTGTLTDQGSRTDYRSSSESTTTNARRLFFDIDDNVNPQHDGNKNAGFALRCVRDN